MGDDFKQIEEEKQKQEMAKPVGSGDLKASDRELSEYTPSESPGVLRIFNQALDNAMTFGLSKEGGLIDQALSKVFDEPAPTPYIPQTTEEKVAAGAGDFLGSIAPVSGLYGTVGRAAAGLVPQVPTLISKAARAIIPGAVSGGIYEGARAATGGEDLPEVLKQAGIGAAMFGGGDLALRGVVKGAELLSRTATPRINNINLNTPVASPRSGGTSQTFSQGTPIPPAQVTAPTINTAAADAFRNKVNRNPNKKTGSFSETLNNLQTQFVDDMAPLERVEKSVRGKVADASESLYKKARLFRGVPTKANEIVRAELSPIIDSIEKAGYTYNDLGDYALAVHARDVNAKGMQSGFTNAEINAVLQKFGTPEMEAARQQLVTVSTKLLDDLAASGVIESTLPGILRQKWPNYMPLFRSFDDNKVEFVGGLSKALANVTSPIKKLQGSQRDVIDPIESMVKNIFQSVSAADRNRVTAELGRLANLDTTGQFVRRLAPGEERGRLNAVYERVNGEKVYYEVEPEVYKAIMSLDRESSSFLVKILQKPASVLRAGATLAPEFSFRNPIRDVVQAYVVSNSGFNPIRDFPAALLDVIKGRDIYRQWLKDSAGYGNLISMDRNVHREALQQVLKQPAGKQFINIINPKAWINVLRRVADVSESATKLGEYKAALRRGVGREEAAYRSRDIMDFSRSGVSIREANKVVAFLNANIQGKSKLLRAIRENPTGVTMRALTAITMPSVGVYLAQKYMANDVQRQTINDAPTWLRDTFWLMPIPGTDLVARIPKPFDLAPIFANLPERVLRYADMKDPNAFDKYFKESLAQYSIPVMLTGLMPFVEGMANYSFFRQGPIIPEREKDLNFPDQYDINTSEVGRRIATGINALTGGEGAFRNFGSPRIIDNTIRGATGGLGTYATSFIDLLLEKGGALQKPPKPERRVSEYPVLRAFLVNEGASGQSMSNLYDERERLTRASGSAKANKQPFPDGGKLKYTEAATKQIGEITKTIKRIESNPGMTSQEKRRRIDELNNRRNELARKAAERIGK